MAGNAAMSKIKKKDALFEQINLDQFQDENTISSIYITHTSGYFYLKINKAENTKELFYRPAADKKERFILSPKSMGDNYTINYFKPNWDSSYVVIGLTKDDEGVSIMRIFDIENQKVLPETITHCWPNGLGGVHWMQDGKGFTYEHMPIIDKKNKGYLLNTKTVLYQIGCDPKNLNIILSKANNPELPFNTEDFPEVDLQHPDDPYLFAGIWGPGPYADYFVSPKKDAKNWKRLFTKKHKVAQFFLKDKEVYFLTAYNAPNFKICKTSVHEPDFENPEIVVPEDPNLVLTDFKLISNGILYARMRNGVETSLFLLDNTGAKEIKLPMTAGHLNIITKEKFSRDFWIELEGWTLKKTLFKYDHESSSFKPLPFEERSSSAELSDLVVEEVEVLSHDGEMIPLSIIHKKGTTLDGKQRVMLSSYGAYGISDRPKLEKYMPYWIQHGGVYAVAHVRGGGEKGDGWYKGGFKTTKPNTWKDFISCTEYLIAKKYTSPQNIAIFSASAGGILIGRAVTERPDLYGCAMIRVGTLNTVRTETGPNGPNNVKEFGTVKDSIEFKALLEMDAYHNITEGTDYPAMLLTAGLKDARVNAWEAGKFTARIREASTSGKPILFFVDSKGGHGLSVKIEKQNVELANMLSFALWQTGHPDFQPN